MREKGPLSSHYIVYIGWRNGAHVVAENQAGIGVRIVALEEALAGRRIIRFEKFGGTDSQRNLVLPRIQQMLGKSYDLVVFNCEHFARWIAAGRPSSNQVVTVSNLLMVSGALMAAARRNSTLTGIGLACIVLGGLGHLSQK